MPFWVAVVLALVCLTGVGEAAAGLAAKYPGDVGIGRDPHVLFADTFTGSVPQIVKRWDDSTNPEGKVFSVSRDVPAGSGDGQSLQMTVTWGTNTTGSLYTRLPRGVDKAYARFYVKYDSKHFAYHCGSHFGAYGKLTPWAQGDPGRPKGDDALCAEIMPAGRYGEGPPAWAVACFWPDMRPSAGGRYWGNNLTPARPALLAMDRWQCVEVMVKANTAPERYDGEMALWLDGKLVMHIKPGTRHQKWTGLGFAVAESGGEEFPGFRWRTTNALKINYFWLLYNIMQPNPKTTMSRMWFDNVVVSTEYVGPIVPVGERLGSTRRH